MEDIILRTSPFFTEMKNVPYIPTILKPWGTLEYEAHESTLSHAVGLEVFILNPEKQFFQDLNGRF